MSLRSGRSLPADRRAATVITLVTWSLGCLAAGVASAWWGCAGGSSEQPSPVMGAPPADRESWDVELRLSEPGLRVQVRAPYVQDQVDRQVSRADSGARIAFCDSAWQPYSTIAADRLLLDYGARQVSLAGRVLVQAPGELELETDSLVWDQPAEVLRTPGRVRLRAASGAAEGWRLQARPELAAWSAEDVSGQWAAGPAGGTLRVHVEARRERGTRRDGMVHLVYDSAQVAWDQVRLRSPRAWLDQARSAMGLDGGVTAEDGDRRVAAQALECDLEARVTTARGAVEIRGPGLLVQAEELRERRQERRWQAQGAPAVWQRDERLVAARRLEYGEAEQTVGAWGEAAFRGDGRALRADTLRYDHARGHLEALGRITLQAPEFEGAATGGRLVYDLQSEQARLSDRPQWRRPRGLSEPLVVRAGELRFDLESERVSGERFEVAAASLRLQAERGAYARPAQRLELAGRVALRQERDGATCVVQGDSLVLALEDGVVAQADWPAALQGRTASAQGQRTWLRAGSGRAGFEEERLRQMELSGEAEVTQQDPGGRGASRFQGRRMVLDFGRDGGLGQVVVEGTAELWSHLPAAADSAGPAGNHVRGERLEIRFAGGELAEVRVTRATEGIYSPPLEQTR